MGEKKRVPALALEPNGRREREREREKERERERKMLEEVSSLSSTSFASRARTNDGRQEAHHLIRGREGGGGGRRRVTRMQGAARDVMLVRKRCARGLLTSGAGFSNKRKGRLFVLSFAADEPRAVPRTDTKKELAKKALEQAFQGHGPTRRAGGKRNSDGDSE